MKSHEPLPWLRARRSHLGATAVACAIAALVSAPVAQAKEGVRNLGGGLEQLAVPAVRAQAQSRQSLAAATAEEALAITPALQFDDAGRVLTRISFDGKTPAAALVESLKGTPGVEVIASDLNYRKGVVEAWVPTSALVSLAGKKGVLSVVRCSSDGDQRRRDHQSGRRATPRRQTGRGRRRLGHHGRCDVGQL